MFVLSMSGLLKVREAIFHEIKKQKLPITKFMSTI